MGISLCVVIPYKIAGNNGYFACNSTHSLHFVDNLVHHSEETRNLCDPPLKSVLRTRCYHIIGTQMWSAHWSSFLSIWSALSLMSSLCIISLFINLLLVSIANDWLPFLVFVAGSATNTRKWQTTNTSKWQTTNTRKWQTTGAKRPGQQNHWRHCHVVRPNGLQFEI